MRIDKHLSGLAILFASVVVAVPAAAQRQHAHRSVPADTPAARPVPRVHAIDSVASDTVEDILDDTVEDSTGDRIMDCRIEDCSSQADVRVVSALFPYDDGRTVGPQLLTLVLENSGTARSAGSVVVVAPRQHLSLVSQQIVPSLAPGERTVVQIPLQVGPDGAPCIAITINQGISPTLDQSIRYASAASANGAPRPAVGGGGR